jgi:hypothetical protein
MRRMRQQEFEDRAKALSRAKKIFMPHLTQNVAVAFDMYLKILAEHKHDRFLTNATTRKSKLDGYVRPKCPECDTDLLLYIINTPKGRSNRKGWRTLWQCPVCAYEKYSKKTVDDWIKELKMEENTRKEGEAYPWGCWKTVG